MSVSVLEVVSAASAAISAGAVILVVWMTWQTRKQTEVLQKRQWDHERLTLKQDVMRRVVGYGHRVIHGLITSEEPYIALNEAHVVFSDCPDVLEALRRLKRKGLGSSSLPLVHAVVVAMARHVNITDPIEEEVIGYPNLPGNTPETPQASVG